MSFLKEGANWLWSIVAIGVIIHYIGTKATRRFDDWTALRTVSKARKRIRSLEIDLQLIEVEKNNPDALYRTMWYNAFETLKYAVFGLGLILVPITTTPIHVAWWETLIGMKQSIGAGLLFAATNPIYDSLYHLRSIIDMKTYRRKTQERIDRLKTKIGEPVALPGSEDQ